MFAYRCITMYVTILPVMKVEQNYCLPKSDGTPTALLLRAWKTWTSLGMKKSGKNLCGDYMFSGHSATLFILMHTIIAYAPKSMKKLRIIVQITVLLAILSISISHQVRCNPPSKNKNYICSYRAQLYYSIRTVCAI